MTDKECVEQYFLPNPTKEGEVVTYTLTLMGVVKILNDVAATEVYGGSLGGWDGLSDNPNESENNEIFRTCIRNDLVD